VREEREENVVDDAMERADHLRSLSPAEFPTPRPFVSVRETAALLATSESWVRRHVGGLPAVRVGRLVRFDSTLILRQFQCKPSSGNCLKPEGEKVMNPQLRRYQRRYVYKTGKK
jgi:excisionase family DNA binding protein